MLSSSSCYHQVIDALEIAHTHACQLIRSQGGLRLCRAPAACRACWCGVHVPTVNVMLGVAGLARNGLVTVSLQPNTLIHKRHVRACYFSRNLRKLQKAKLFPPSSPHTGGPLARLEGGRAGGQRVQEGEGTGGRGCSGGGSRRRGAACRTHGKCTATPPSTPQLAENSY